MDDLLKELIIIENKIDEVIKNNNYENILHLLDERKTIFKKLEKYKNEDKIKHQIEKIIESDKERYSLIKNNLESIKISSKDIQTGKKAIKKGYFSYRNEMRSKKFDGNG